MSATLSGLADLPATTDDDGLGLTDVGSALAEFVQGCATPMTIGLQGAWGTGKTSLMHFIAENIGRQESGSSKENNKTTHVWFNTWAYSQFNREDQLPVSLMLSLTQQLRGLALGADYSRRDQSKFENTLRKFGKAIVKAASAYVHKSTGGALDLSGFSDLFDTDNTPIDEAQLAHKTKQVFGEVVAEFNEITRRDRLVMFIDDLDRLRPERAIEVLEVVKNFLDVEGCVFVLAIDYEVVMAGLASRKGYELDSGEGKSFFDKIIQVPFRMPVSRYHPEVFAAKHIRAAGMVGSKMTGFWLSETDDEAKRRLRLLVQNSANSNPRSIKRMLNLLTLQNILLKRTRGGQRRDTDNHHVVLLPLTALQVLCDPAYQLIVSAGKDVDLALIALCGIDLTEFAALGDIEPRREDLLGSGLQTTTSGPDWGEAVRDRAENLDNYIRKVDVLRDLLKERPYGFSQSRFYSLRTVCELLFRAIDYTANGVEDGRVSNAEKAYFLETLKVVGMTGDNEVGKDDSSSCGTLASFIEDLTSKSELTQQQKTSLQKFVSSLSNGGGSVRVRWGSGGTSAAHIYASQPSGSKKFMTIKGTGAIQVNLDRAGLSETSLARRKEEFEQDYQCSLAGAGTNPWIRIQNEVWKHDSDLQQLERHVREIGKTVAMDHRHLGHEEESAHSVQEPGVP